MTLTYGVDYPLSGRKVKRDLNRMLTRLRQVYPDIEYVWFLEFQRRGAPHVHILTSLDGPDDTARWWYAGLWANIACNGLNCPYDALEVYNGRLIQGARLHTLESVRWWHNRQRAWEQIRVREGAARYAAKYALKPYQKKVPKEYTDVGRFWGASRNLSMGDGDMVYGSEAEIREFLELKGRNFDGFDVLPKICVW